MSREKKNTPMMEQYLAIKKDYKDTLLFYRMGDFYEMFYDDAKEAASILEIALTARNKNSPNPVPMCGVPIKSADIYIAKLIEKDIKVAICEQTEDPAEAKGLVRREVVRVITPGMIQEPELLKEDENNFIAAITVNKNAGIAYIDISTGDYRITENKNPEIIFEELKKINPSEIIVSEENLFLVEHIKSNFNAKALTLLPDSYFDIKACKEKILEQFNLRSLKGLGYNHLDASISSAGAILFYIADTQKKKASHLKYPEKYSLDNHLVLDETTSKNLELISTLRDNSRKGSLLDIIDNTVTAMGSRLLKQWLLYPLIEKEKIFERQDAVSEFILHRLKNDDIRNLLKQIYDIERLATRFSMGSATPRDMLSLKNSLLVLPELLQYLTFFNSPIFKPNISMEETDEIFKLLENAISDDAPISITEGGIFKKDFNQELNELISLSTDSKSWLASYEAKEKTNTGINTLRVKFNKIFGYFIEIPKSQADKMPVNYIRKQTLVNSERYINEELKAFEDKVLFAEEKRKKLEYKLFCEIRSFIADKSRLIQNIAAFTATLDILSSFAATALQRNYVKPKINNEKIICIKNGRHPVVESMLESERFVPNDVYLDNHENQVLIITGPNMAGKSTILRQTAIIVLLAQTGSYVPAEFADIAITDRIFTRVGASDNLAGGQSTFMVEMEETANIINNATKDSLVVMDEIGRGTSTFDGISIAWAVAESLHSLKGNGVKTLFATHYHELTELENTLPKVKNFTVAVKEENGKISFLRKMIKGGANKSYGIQVAGLAGIPINVIERAKILLHRMESGEHILSNKQLKKLKNRSKQLEFFPTPEKKLVESISNLNINEITPVEALNCLSALIEEAKKILTD